MKKAPSYKVYRQDPPVFVGRYNGEDVFRPSLIELGTIEAKSIEAMNIAKMVFKIAAPVLEAKNV